MENIVIDTNILISTLYSKKASKEDFINALNQVPNNEPLVDDTL